MKKTKFIEAQVIFAIKQSETGIFVENYLPDLLIIKKHEPYNY